MPWFVYKDDLLIPVEARALTVNEAVSADLTTTRDALDSVDEYCLYEVSGEVIFKYWRDKKLSVKLIHADDPANALMHYCNAEKAGLARCSSSRIYGR
jgi:hypothetical protein